MLGRSYLLDHTYAKIIEKKKIEEDSPKFKGILFYLSI